MLPKLPYKGRTLEREIVEFRGLDRTEGAPDGALSDAVNLSTEEYPTLTQRAPRTQITGYTAPTDIFGWDGRLVAVDGGQLKLDGTVIGAVNPGKKQFAVVNTKLCIWPDKVCYDRVSGTMKHLDAALSAGTLTVTDDSITAALSAPTAQNAEIRFSSPWRAAGVYVYGVDASAVAACYTNSAWDLDALDALAQYKTFAVPGELIGRIVIPWIVNGNYFFVTGNQPGTVLPDTSLYNGDGYYAVIRSFDLDDSDQLHCYADVYRAGTDNVLFSSAFAVGDAVNVSGTRLGICDVQHAVITAIDDSTNTLTFPEGTFYAPSYYHTLTDDLAPGVTVRLKLPGTMGYLPFTPTAKIPAGRTLFVETYAAGDSVYVWDALSKRVEAQYAIASSGSGTVYDASAYDPIDGAAVTVTRAVPDFDFICAKDNRLWGVSNRQSNEIWNAQTQQFDTYTARVIFASALGDPTNWYTFQGVDSDAWQVADGSEGDFTALCAFGGSVCAWKENRLHRVFGSNPSEYYMSDSIFDGVAAGCARSVTVVNEVMYYVGRGNVYAYAGGKVPQAVGTPLGRPYADAQAVAGSNGRRLYLGWKTGASASELLTFDLARGLWMREDDKTAAAFADVGGALYLLCSNGALWRLEHGSETVAWRAVFRPFDETKIIYKHYIRVCLRLDMAEGSSITVKVRFDNGAEQTLLSADATRTMTKDIMLPPNRADRFTVTVSGTGSVKLRHMSREYYPGSERV